MPFNEFKFTCKWGTKSAVLKFVVPINLEQLRAGIMDCWTTFYTKEFHLEHSGQQVDDATLTALITARKVNELTVIPECIGFSDYKKEEDYLTLEGIMSYGNLVVEQDPFDVEIWKDEISHAHKDIMNKIKLYGPITNTCEASVREHVSPVLSLSALIAEGLMMKAEPKISGLRGNGPLDCLFLYKKFAVALTEVKDEDIQSGLAQNDAQLVASRQYYKFHLQIHVPGLATISKKRKYLEIDITAIPSFGIVSSGRDWMFQKLVETPGIGTIIHKSAIISINLVSGHDAEIKDQMVQVVRRIVWILKEQKAKIDEHPTAKRVRNEL